MADIVYFGARCRCGQLIPVQGIEEEAPVSLDEKQHKLMLEGWQRIVTHVAPGGCGQGVPGICTPDKLVIYGIRREDGILSTVGIN